jgi:hypothetical protein
VIKGLTLLDAALDLDGSFMPGKSTLVVCGTNPKTLKALAERAAADSTIDGIMFDAYGLDQVERDRVLHATA